MKNKKEKKAQAPQEQAAVTSTAETVNFISDTRPGGMVRGTTGEGMSIGKGTIRNTRK